MALKIHVDLGKGQIVLLGNQGMDAPCLRFNPMGQTIAATRSGGKTASVNRTSQTDTKPFSRLTTRQTF